MKKLLSMSLILSVCSSNLWAQTNSDVCALNESAAIKKVKIPDLPGFFFKVEPSGKHIAFIGERTNKLLDLETGKSTPLPGNVDPVWTPDGKYLTVPYVNINNGDSSFGFYGTSEVVHASKSGGDLTKLGVGAKIEGVYQSLGKNPNGYRMVTDEKGLSLGDVSVDESGVQIKSEFEMPCGNLGAIPTDLPMLSKDGKYLSVFDRESKTTKIYNVDNDKSCALAIDLDVATGKVSFNNDSSQISFHVDQFSDFEEGYFSGISKDKLKNVIVVNLEASDEGKKLKATSWAQASNHVKPGDGAYYPDFDEKGNIYYLEDIGNHYQFVQTSPSLLDFNSTSTSGLIDIVSCFDCHNKEGKSNVSLIAKMWSDICRSQQKIDLTLAPSLVSAIDPKACLAMVDEFWTESLGVSKQDLKAACPKSKEGSAHTIGDWGETKVLDAKNIIQSRCIMCHTRSMEYEAEEVVNVATGPETTTRETRKVKHILPALKSEGNDPVTTARMMHAIEAYGSESGPSMPKGSSLEQEQVELLRSFFNRELLDIPREARYELYSTNIHINRYSDEELIKVKAESLGQNPNATEEMKKELDLWTDCVYAQKGCQTYIDYKLPVYTAEAQKLPPERREKYIQEQIINFKCINYFEVTKEQCIEAKLDRQIKTK